MRELRTYASIQLIGEYGVYANGKMVQLMLPLCSTMRMILSDTTCGESPGSPDLKVKVEAEHSDKVYSAAQKASQQEKLARRIGKIAEWLKERNAELRSGSVEFLTDFPLGLGIEDNLNFLAQWCLGPECTFQEVAERVVECEWKHRPTCSYAYLLPAIKIAAQDASHDNIFLLSRKVPEFKSWDEFGIKNSPDVIRPAWRWIEKAGALRLNGLMPSFGDSVGAVFDIALFARPKAALLKALHPSVKEAVTTLPLTPRSRCLLSNLGNLTDQAFEVLEELAGLPGRDGFGMAEKENFLNLWWELGRIFTCYHFTMSAMQRTDPLSDKFVIEVTQRMNVVGAKTTASGLGGTVLVLYFAEPGKQHEAVLEEIQKVAERYGYTNLGNSIFSTFYAH